MTFYVYLIRCSVNGKGYVGKTYDVSMRWYKHRWVANDGDDKRRGWHSALYGAMRKHGFDAFSVEVLEEYPDEASAFVGETRWIDRLGTFGPGGYNMSRGGEGQTGFNPTAEARAKMARHGSDNGCFGRVWSNEERGRHRELTKKQFADNGHPFTGRTHSAEARAKISAAAMGNKRCLGRKTSPRSPEARAKQSAAIKAKWAEKGGEWYKPGHVISNETRTNMSRGQRASWTPERRAASAERMRARLAAMAPEARAEMIQRGVEKRRATLKVKWAALSPEERIKMTAKAREALLRKRVPCGS